MTTTFGLNVAGSAYDVEAKLAVNTRKAKSDSLRVKSTKLMVFRCLFFDTLGLLQLCEDAAAQCLVRRLEFCDIVIDDAKSSFQAAVGVVSFKHFRFVCLASFGEPISDDGDADAENDNAQLNPETAHHLDSGFDAKAFATGLPRASQAPIAVKPTLSPVPTMLGHGWPSMSPRATEAIIAMTPVARGM